MKFFLIVSFFIFNLAANDFKYYINIYPSMSSSSIANTIENAQDGTVIHFKDGKYNFYNRTIHLKQKKYISIEGSAYDKVVISSLTLLCENTNDIHIKNITYKNDSQLKFTNSKNIFIDNILLKKTQVALYASSGQIKGVATSGDYKYPILFMDNSTVKITKVNLANDLSSILAINKSEVQVSNSSISCSKIAILSVASNLHIMKNNFINKNEAMENSVFVNMNNSSLIATKNNFKNNDTSITLYNKSNGYIKKNNFEEINNDIDLIDSSANILDNEISNAIGDYSFGVTLKNSEATIHNNSFTKIYRAVTIIKKSSLNISQNRIGNLLRQYYKDDDGTKKFHQGLGIFISTDCLANITNNISYNMENNYIGIADLGAKVYSLNNEKKIYFNRGSKSNQVIHFDIPNVKDFRNVFDTIKISSINYKQLKVYKPKKKIVKVPNTIKGYLSKEVIVDCGGYEEVIEEGTWIVFNTDDNTLIEPSEHSGKPLDEKPQLNISSDQIQIKIIPLISNPSSNVVLLSFTIESNVRLTDITLNDKKIKFNNSNNKLTTKPRRVKNFNKAYKLKLSNSNFEEYYDCRFNNAKNVKCIKKVQDTL